MMRILSIIVLVLALLLLPPAVLAFISQDAVPGQNTYHIKRTLENGLLTLASINRNTKALFSIQESQTRFDEANKLLAEGHLTPENLNDLVSQTAQAAREIQQVQDPVQKKELSAKLSASIVSYQKQLTQVSTQLAQVNNQMQSETQVAAAPTLKPTIPPK